MCEGTMSGRLKKSWDTKNPTEPFPFVRSEVYNRKKAEGKVKLANANQPSTSRTARMFQTAYNSGTTMNKSLLGG